MPSDEDAIDHHVRQPALLRSVHEAPLGAAERARASKQLPHEKRPQSRAKPGLLGLVGPSPTYPSTTTAALTSCSARELVPRLNMKEDHSTKARGQLWRRQQDSGGTPSTRARPAFVLVSINCTRMVYMTAAETHLVPEHSPAEPNAPLLLLPPLPPDCVHPTRHALLLLLLLLLC